MNTLNNDKPHQFAPYDPRMISDFLTQLLLELCIVSQEIDVKLKNQKDGVEEKLEAVYTSGANQKLTYFRRKYGERLWELAPLADTYSINSPEGLKQLKPKVDEMVCRLDDLIPFIDHIIFELERFEVMVSRQSLEEIEEINNGWIASPALDLGLVEFFSVYQAGNGEWDADPCLISHLAEAPAIAVSRYDNEGHSFLKSPDSIRATENGTEGDLDVLVIHVHDAEELKGLLIAVRNHFGDLNEDVSL